MTDTTTHYEKNTQIATDKYGFVFDMIRSYVRSAVWNVTQDLQLADRIAEQTRVMCSAGLVPPLSNLAVSLATEYLRNNPARVEVITYLPEDDAEQIEVFANGINIKPELTSIDPGRGGWLLTDWRKEREEDANNASPAAAKVIRAWAADAEKRSPYILR